MIKQKIEYFPNYEIKTIKEFNGDNLICISIFDEQGNLIYKENKELLYINEYNKDGTKLFYLENKLKQIWDRNLYNQDNNKLFEIRSDGVWYEYRYNKYGNPVYYLNSYGLACEYGHWGIKSIDISEPEKHCSYDINKKKNT